MTVRLKKNSDTKSPAKKPSLLDVPKAAPAAEVSPAEEPVDSGIELAQDGDEEDALYEPLPPAPEPPKLKIGKGTLFEALRVVKLGKDEIHYIGGDPFEIKDPKIVKELLEKKSIRPVRSARAA